MRNLQNVLVTPRAMSNGHPSLQILQNSGYQVLLPFGGKRPTEAELLNILPSCVGYIAGGEIISGKVLNAAKSLQVISRNGIGIDNIDLDTAQRKNIVLKVARGANSQSVAELTISLMFAVVRSLYDINYALKQQQWVRICGMELEGKTLGILGSGEIGCRVAKMASGLGMGVLAHDPMPRRSMRDAKFSYVDFDVLLVKSDILSLHCPLSPDASPLLSTAEFAKMKQGAYLINTARASLVEQHSLFQCLENGAISAYAVDAFEQEPPEFSELLLHPKVLVSSHIGGYTTESINRAAENSVKNLLEVLEYSQEV